MKNNKGLTLMELLILVAILVVILSLVINVSIHTTKKFVFDNTRPIVLDLFNGLEVSVQTWMFGISITGEYSIESVAQEWCISHSIPVDQQEAKVKELAEKFKTAISGLKVKLTP